MSLPIPAPAPFKSLKRRCESAEATSGPPHKHLRSSPVRKRRRTCSELSEDDTASCKKQKTLDDGLQAVPDLSSSIRGCVEAWIATDNPNYSSIMASSSQSSQNKRRSKGGKSSHTPSRRDSTEATSADTEAASIKTIHDPRVRNILGDNGIHYSWSREDRATNHDDICERLAASRGSLSPSQGYQLEEEYDKFFAAQEMAPNEDTLIATAFLPSFHRGMKPCGMNSSFASLSPLTEEQIPPPKPDIYFGEEYTCLAPEARKVCDQNIVPYSRSPYLVVNHTTEVKGIAGRPEVARTQVTYNGAAGARAIDTLRAHSGPSLLPLDSDARTHGATFANGTLSLYATHSVPSKQGLERDYITQQVAGEMASASPRQFRRALELYRNQYDLAREHRAKAVLEANKANARSRSANAPQPDRAQTRPQRKRSHVDNASEISTSNNPLNSSALESEFARWVEATFDHLIAKGLSAEEAHRRVKTILSSGSCHLDRS